MSCATYEQANKAGKAVVWRGTWQSKRIRREGGGGVGHEMKPARPASSHCVGLKLDGRTNYEARREVELGLELVFVSPTERGFPSRRFSYLYCIGSIVSMQHHLSLVLEPNIKSVEVLLLIALVD